MTESTLPDVRGESAVEVYTPPPMSMDDFVVPRLFLTTPTSDSVKEGDLPSGAMIVTLGQDDDDPYVLSKYHKDDAKNGHWNGYVLGMTKFVAEALEGGGMQPRSELNAIGPRRGTNEWWFYQYLVWIPVYEDESIVPVQWGLWKTAGRPAAKMLNTLITQNDHRHGDKATPIHIEVHVDTQTSRQTGQSYFVPKVRLVDPGPKDEVETAVAKRDEFLPMLQRPEPRVETEVHEQPEV